MNDLAIEIREINKTKGWNVLQYEEWDDPYKIPAILALIHSETSEALEAFRKNDKENFKEEICDIIIRTLDLAGGIEDFDISINIRKKLEINKQRSYRHGNKKL